MAITHVADYRVPTVDDANETSTTSIFDKDAVTIATDDVVLMLAQTKQTATTNSVTTTGGQTWTEEIDVVHNGLSHAIYQCVFNGTWDADPVVTNNGVANPRVMWVAAFRGVDTTTPWDVSPVAQAQAVSSTFVEATWDTATDGAWALVGGGSNDNNTWTVDNSFVAPSGSGNIYWRTSGGTDASQVITRKEIPTAGAVGATTLTQATLGSDSGWSWHGALKPAAAAAATSLIYPSGMPRALLVQ